MPRLGVNIDHVASVRQLRRGIEPEPVFAAFICESSGADSIVVHLREDRRHIKEEDLYLLKKTVKTKLNLEMSSVSEIVDIACQLKPQQATFVPERREELTTEGGLDVVSGFQKIKRVKEKLEKNGITVSLFIDPDKKQIDAAKKMNIKMIELHTGSYAECKTGSARERELRKLKANVVYAKSRGILVNAGHGLDYYNVSKVAQIEGIDELNIGYSIICRAVLVGLGQAVREMKALIKG
jgi:pyridoxine 5-phosphate synthase